MAFLHFDIAFAASVPRVFALKPASSCSIGKRNLHKIVVPPILAFNSTPRSVFMKNSAQASPTIGAETDTHSNIQIAEILPELYTEFMVDMKCEGCVNSVKNSLQKINSIKNIEVDLPNQIVRILGSSPVNTMMKAMEQAGRKARLIGQGKPDEFAVSAAVAEFKGPQILGVVRIAQVSMESARLEANFSGLPTGDLTWCINEYGDLTNGALSTGKAYQNSSGEGVGVLGRLDVDENGDSNVSKLKQNVRVSDLIGRSVVVYKGEEGLEGIAAAVIARSAGVGQNYKKVCLCDGTVIWDSSHNDFIATKL